MSKKAWEKMVFMTEVYVKLEAETEVKNGKVQDVFEGLKVLREKYGL